MSTLGESLRLPYNPSPTSNPHPLTRLPSTKNILSYCSNAYGGTSWDEILASISKFARLVRPAISPSLPLSLGLWIPAPAAEYALRSDRAKDLFQTAQDAGVTIHSFNGFPHGNFHQGPVKQKVFSPDWTTHARIQYTTHLMSIATQGLEPGKEFGISTVPISWSEWIRTPEDLEVAALHLVGFASDAYFAEKANGVRLHLALEPEPFGYLSKSSEVVRFFRNTLLSLGAKELQRRWGLRASQAEELLLDKIRICYDTCHAAVEFEKPSNILARYNALGIKLGRVQISSAPILHLRKGRCLDGTLPSKTLSPFQKDTYLHQVIGQDLDRKVFRFADLPEALKTLEENEISGEFRIHLHVPIFLERLEQFGPLFTTQDHILELIKLDRTSPLCQSWEIETYTWNILPPHLQMPTLEEGMAREINWIESIFLGGKTSEQKRPFQSSARTGASF